MKQLLGDIRALGKWAPVRAIYEVLHRSGVIGIVLRRRASRPAPEMVAPFSTWPPERFRTGWQPTADAIAGGEVTIFGETVQIGETPNWHDDGAGGSWERVAPWRINLYAKAERDVKYAWELARHRHLVVLARAASEDRPARNIATIETHLESWFEQNPPENGVHWFSNLELSIRALAWLEVLGLVGRRLTPRTRASLAAHLYHSGRHIVAHLPLTLSSMRNNHLIGDAVGLVAIGKAFPGDRSAARWVRLGDRMLKRHLPRHIAKDGSSLEDSLGYRAFVMELLAARVAVGDPPATVVRSLAAATKHAARSGVGNGPVPRFGDWDGGTALAAGPTTLSLPVASLDIAAEVSGIVDITEPVSDGSDTGGGLARLAQGPWTIYLKAGTGLSHQHADLLSVAIAHNGFWITGDPANGSYNRDPGERNYYRMSRAHNVLRIEDTDQRGPQRRFRWHYDPSCSLGAPFTEGRYRVMWGNHDAYDRLEPGHTVVRACLVSTDAVIVADWISGGPAQWDLSLPLAPDVNFVENPASRRRPTDEDATAEPRFVESGLEQPAGASLGLLLPGVATTVWGSTKPYGGWWAEDYDAVRPATRLDVSGTGEEPIVWAVWENRRPLVAIEQGALVVDGHRIALAGTSSGRFRPAVEKR